MNLALYNSFVRSTADFSNYSKAMQNEIQRVESIQDELMRNGAGLLPLRDCRDMAMRAEAHTPSANRVALATLEAIDEMERKGGHLDDRSLTRSIETIKSAAGAWASAYHFIPRSVRKEIPLPPSLKNGREF